MPEGKDSRCSLIPVAQKSFLKKQHFVFDLRGFSGPEIDDRARWGPRRPRPAGAGAASSPSRAAPPGRAGLGGPPGPPVDLAGNQQHALVLQWPPLPEGWLRASATPGPRALLSRGVSAVLSFVCPS